jgi:hypothetical protein
MSIAVPTIGSKVRVTTNWYGEIKNFTGVVVQSIFKSPYSFAVHTGNPQYPVSEFDASGKHLSIEVIAGKSFAAATGTKAWKVKSKDKIYLVTRVGAKYNCTCTGFEYRKTCKHIDAVSKKK